jgi:serine protease Do
VGATAVVPAETVKMVVGQLREKGVVTRGLIGLQVSPISPEIDRDLVKKVSRAAPGTAVKLGVFRKGEHKSVTVTLAEIPK